MSEEIKHFRFASCTDIGPSYSVNQDSFEYNQVHNRFVLADGVGGHQGGEIASRFIVKNLMAGQSIIGQQLTNPAMLKQVLKLLVIQADSQLKDLGITKELDMGTTVVTGLVVGQQLHYTSVGDSRLYLLRNHLLAQLTTDDTLKQQVIDSTQLLNSSVNIAVPSNIVTQALGLTSPINVHYGYLNLKPGDILLCSTDGLHDVLSLAQLQKQLNTFTTLQQCADDLVAHALELGSRDNISVLLMEYPQPLFESLVHKVKQCLA